MTSSLKLAVGYMRCSTEMQEDSPEQQKQEIERFAAQHGYQVLDWYVDFGKSGTTFEERPAFQNLRRMVERKPMFRYVICYDESRWGRAIDIDESTHWKFYFRKRGVDVVLVKTAVDPKNEFAPMLTAMEAVQASSYSKKLSELTLRGTLSNAKNKFSNGGTAPYGYKRVAVNKLTGERRELKSFWDERTGKFVGERCSREMESVVWDLGTETEQSAVRKIFEMRAAGNAYMTIVRYLNEHHIPCSQRGRWRNIDSKWSKNTVKAVLENEVYIGTRVYNKMSDSKIIAKRKGVATFNASQYKHWRNDRSEWVTSENAHPAIVTKEVWEKANGQKHTGEKQNRSHVLKSEYLLSNLMRCSHCGFTFQGMTNISKGKPYHKYIDSGWQNKGICSACYIKRDELEAFVLNGIRETLREPKMMQRIQAALEMLVESEPQENKTRVKELDERLSELETASANLVKGIEAGKQLQVLLNRLEAVETEKNKLMAEREVLTETVGQVVTEDLSAEVAAFVENFEERFRLAALAEKKMLMKQCVAGILVDRDAKVAWCYVRRVPTVNPVLARVYNRIERGHKAQTARQAIAERAVVGIRSGGDRT
jgi:site-specific DNA recombinase